LTDNQPIFLVDPRHKAFLEHQSTSLGDNQLTWTQRLTLLAIIFASLWIVITFFADQPEYLPEDEIIRDAEVKQLYVDEESFDYRVIYSFDTEVGETITLDRAIGESTYETLRDQTTFQIGYPQGNPEDALPILDDGDNATNRTILLMLVILFVITLIYIGYFWLYRPTKINHQLEENGALLTGHLLEIWPSTSGRKYFINVHYRFDKPDGSAIETKLIRQRNDLKKVPLPRSGTELRILYVDDTLYRVL